MLMKKNLNNDMKDLPPYMELHEVEQTHWLVKPSVFLLSFKCFKFPFSYTQFWYEIIWRTTQVTDGKETKALTFDFQSFPFLGREPHLGEIQKIQQKVTSLANDWPLST